MSIPLTATRLRAELFKTLDQVIATGDVVEIERPGGTIRIVAAATGSRLARLRPHPETIIGDAEALASHSWEDTWQPLL